MKNVSIRKMQSFDKDKVINMMRAFYTSPALITNGSEEIFNNNFEACTSDCPFVEGYVFENENGVLGYAILAKSFSTEFGKRCVWLEDLYISDEYRGQGIGSSFFNFMEEKYTGVLFRLEAENGNENAIALYKKRGFTALPYLEMKK